MRTSISVSDQKKLRKQILELSSQYAKAVFMNDNKFTPGETHIPVSGKLIDHQEIKFSIDACLDGWFTTGRYAKQFETKFAQYMEQKFCLLTNSGSSANLIALSALTSPELK